MPSRFDMRTFFSYYYTNFHMNIWLITIGESIPRTDGDNAKQTRAAILADLLQKKGHRVVWWTSTFDHDKKRHRFHRDFSIEITDNYKIILLHATGYRKNISLIRILDHFIVSHKFFKRSKQFSKPDIILCSYPTIGLSYFAVKYGIISNIPIVIDVRDLWPDNFLTVIPRWFRCMAKTLLYPLFKMKYFTFRRATAILGTSLPYVEWGLRDSNREMTNLDRYFPLANRKEAPPQKDIEHARRFWEGLHIDKNKFIICFFGTINKKFDFDTIIEAAKKFKDNPHVLFIICGEGDNLEYYKKRSKSINNIIYPGLVGEAEKRTLMHMSSVGLAPYHSTEEFRANYPTKIFEYLSSGLPILSCLMGISKTLLKNSQCGLTYANNSVDDFISKLNFLLAHPEILKSMSENALKLYEEKFVAEKVYAEMIIHLEKIHEACQSPLSTVSG